MKEVTYQESKDYDKKIYLNHHELDIYSKRKFKQLNISKTDILGEIKGSCLNKYKTYSTFNFHGIRYKIYQLNKSFKLLNKTVGYFETEDKKYIKVLKRTYLLIPILIGLILFLLLQAHRLYTKENVLIAQSNTSDITYLKGHIYQDSEIVKGSNIELIHNNEVMDTTYSDEEGIYFFTGLDKKDYYLKISYKEIEFYKPISIQETENWIDIDLPSFNMKEIIQSDLNHIYIDHIESLIENPNIDSNYSVTLLIEEKEDTQFENSLCFEIKILLEEYQNDTLINSYYLEEYPNELEVILSDLRLYEVMSVYQKINDQLQAIEDYSFKSNTLRFPIKQSGTYLIELNEKDFNSKGTTTFSYNPQANYDINTQTLTYQFKQSIDSTHKTKIKVYLSSNDELIEAGESDVFEIGQEEDSILLNKKLEKGIYDGILRVYYLDSETNQEIVDMDIPITIISND